MGRFAQIILVLILLFCSACAVQQESEVSADTSSSNFVSQEYGFSFVKPGGWEERTRDLPDKWALVKGTDTLIFTVNTVSVSDVLILGRLQALRDTYPQDIETVDQEAIDSVNEMVSIAEFNGIRWYTYALRFEDEGINSIVSGTVCDGREVTMVLVSGLDSYELNKEVYTDMLGSFSC